MAVFDCELGRELTPQEIAALPPEPRGTVAERKARLWDQVKARRDQAIDGGVTVQNVGTFDSDEGSRVNITGAVTMAMIAGEAFAISWKLADNSIVELDGPGMIAVGLAVGAHVAAAHANAQALGTAINAASTHAALDATDVEAGWP